VAKEIVRVVAAPSEAVWAVLADGWLYANWVVGASRVRQVDTDWPAPGSCIHHSFGAWPAVVDDTTEVLDSTTEQSLELSARGWPLGEARVRLGLQSDGPHTEVTLVEDVVAGPGRLFPKPLRQLAIAPRNTETLQRLALLAEGRYRERLDA